MRWLQEDASRGELMVKIAEISVSNLAVNWK